MNGRQSGAVRYLASLSLYYYSLGPLRRSVSSLVCVVPAFFFCSLLLFCALPSFPLFLCLPSAPFLKSFSFFFSAGLTVRRPGSLHFVSFASMGYLAHSQDIRFAVPVTGHRAQPVSRIDSRCTFCVPRRAHGSPGSSRLFFRQAESLSAFGTARGNDLEAATPRS